MESRQQSMEAAEKRETSPVDEPSVIYSVVICALFVALSTWATLYNKYIFDRVLPSSNCLLLAQNIFTLICLRVGKSAGWLRYDVDMRHVDDWMVGVMYSINVLAGLGSLMFVNIAMFGALKRCTVIASWVIEYWLTPNPTTMRCIPALSLMTVGTFVASANDLQFSAYGYALAIGSCVTQAAAFELGRRTTAQNKGVCAVLFSNAVVSVIIQIVIMSFTREFEYLRPSALSWSLCLHLLVNSASCLAMNYVIFLNCSVNSPLAHAVTGNIKAIFTTVVGLLVFATPMTWLGHAGLVANFGGAGWFSAVKYRHQVEKRRRHHLCNSGGDGGAAA